MPRIPKRLQDDLGSVSLDADDRHLLSLVDSSLSEVDLAFVTGKTPAQVAEDLERLAMLGLVDFVGREATGPDAASALRAADQAAMGDKDGAVAAGLEAAPESDEPGIELDPEERTAIRALHHRLHSDNYYQLLGVEPEATKKEIRKAYNSLARRFHPDRHFRKTLGSYKQKIEAVFTELTKAHDTLRSNERREDYDAAEGIVRRSRPPEPPPEEAAPPADRPAEPPPPAAAEAAAAAPLDQPGPTAPAAPPPAHAAAAAARPGGPADPAVSPAAAPPEGPKPALEPRAAEAPAGAVRRDPRAPVTRASAARARPTSPGGGAAAEPRSPGRSPTAPGRPPATPTDPGATPGARPAAPTPPASDASRKARADALARKLLGKRRFGTPVPAGRAPGGRGRRSTPQPGSQPNPPAAPGGERYQPVEGVARSAAEVLRQRYQEIGAVAKDRKRDQYVAQAKAAFSRGDYPLAAEAYRLASELAPDDVRLRQLAEQAAELAGKK